MRRLLLFVLLLLGTLPALAAPPPPRNSPVSYRRTVIQGVRAYVVTVDLNCRRISLVPVASNGHYQSFRRFIQRSKPLAAINGTFFDPRTATIVCNLISGGKLLSEGRVGHSLLIDLQNKAQLLTTAGQAGRFLKLSQWAFGLSGGPTLLRAGQYVYAPYDEGFRDPGLLRGAASRSAIGITKHNKLLLVSVRYPVRLRRLAWMMKSLGARDAINLDGGSSTGLYCMGRFLARPRRMLTNIVAVQLLPPRMLPASEAKFTPGWSDTLPPASLESPVAEAPVDTDYVATEEVPVVESEPAKL